MAFQLDPFPAWVRQLLQRRICRDIVNLISDYSHHEIGSKKYYLPGPFCGETLRQIEEGMKHFPPNLAWHFTQPLAQAEWEVIFLLLRLAGSQVWLSSSELNELNQRIQAAGFIQKSRLTPGQIDMVGVGLDVYQSHIPQRPKTLGELIYLELGAGSYHQEYIFLSIVAKYMNTYYLSRSPNKLFQPFPFLGYYNISAAVPRPGLLEHMASDFLEEMNKRRPDSPLFAFSEEAIRQSFVDLIYYQEKY